VKTTKKTLPATIGIVALVVMAKVMGGTGQIMVLAQGTAAFTKQYFAFISPMIGILGAFITSSNLASNILFAEFQQTTSEVLTLYEPSILAAQTAGGAMGNTLAPGNVLLGTTTAGILGKEGQLLAMIIPLTLSIAGVIGLILMLINLF
jgi:lactate permease